MPVAKRRVSRHAVLWVLSGATMASCAAFQQRSLIQREPGQVPAVAQYRTAEGSQFQLCWDCPQPTQKTPVGGGLIERAALAEAKAPAALAEVKTLASASSEPPVPSVTDMADTSDTYAQRVKAAAEPQIGGSKVTIFFDTNQAELGEGARTALEHFWQAQLKDQVNQEVTLVITGYTDAVGQKAYNDVLALQRAEMVKRHFQGFLPAESKVDFEVEGKGSCCYVAGNVTKWERARNRRVVAELIVTKPLTLAQGALTDAVAQ